MKRTQVQPRQGWEKILEQDGMVYHSLGLSPDEAEGVYWDESVAYQFDLNHILRIEAATEELYDLCLNVVDRVCNHADWQTIMTEQFDIPAAFTEAVRLSWQNREPAIMSRFDLALDAGGGAPKMLEINGDTPTLVIETALVQWRWMQDVFPDKDQFNSLHEKLIMSYRTMRDLMPAKATMVFSSLPQEVSEEEYRHAMYFQDLADQAGIRTAFCALPNVGWNEGKGVLTDLLENPISFWSRLWPWELILTEDFAPGVPFLDKIVQALPRTGVVEPPWKIMLSSKAILPWLWSLNPGHPNLLPSSFQKDEIPGQNIISKPSWGREGANMWLKIGDVEQTTGGSYGDHTMIYQQAVELPCFDGNFVVAGSWIADGRAAGMILREDTTRIIVNTSKVVPHYIEPDSQV